MLTTLITLVVIGVIGWFITTYIPMIEPVRVAVIVFFAIIALYYIISALHGLPF